MKVYSIIESVNEGGHYPLVYGSTKEMLEVLKNICIEHNDIKVYEKFVGQRSFEEIEKETEYSDANIFINDSEVVWMMTVVEVGKGF